MCVRSAGEDAQTIQPTLWKMKASGVRAILDYAAVEWSSGGAFAWLLWLTAWLLWLLHACSAERLVDWVVLAEWLGG